MLANDYNFKKSLFIFWRLIANNLDSSITFKIGFKVLFKVKDSETISKEKIIKEGQDTLYNKNDFTNTSDNKKRIYWIILNFCESHWNNVWTIYTLLNS